MCSAQTQHKVPQVPSSLKNHHPQGARGIAILGQLGGQIGLTPLRLPAASQGHPLILTEVVLGVCCTPE